MNTKRSKKQGGFTLVEMAVVMVIIGIILGAILQGQSLINNARAKSVMNDMKGLEAIIWAYYDRQGRFPGDCDDSGLMGIAISPITVAGTPIVADALDTDPGSTTAPATLSCAPALTLTGTRDTPLADIRSEHLLSHETPNDEITKHVFNGLMYPTFVTDGVAAPNTKNINAIVVFNIPQWLGEMIDASIDGTVDGLIGRIRYMAIGAATVTMSGTAWPARTETNLETAIVYYFDDVAPVL